jgi:cyanophycinase
MLGEVKSCDNYLFLLGGDPTQKPAAEAFVTMAGGAEARLVLMLLDSQQKYLQFYVNNWLELGVEDYKIIMPNDNSVMDYDSVVTHLRNATGIFIGCGDTLKYHYYYAAEPIKSTLVSCYEKGVPIAGCSAGTLILPELLLVSPNDTGDEQVVVGTGIGLISNQAVGVHFSEWDDIDNLIEGMVRTNTKLGWGIDEEACAVFKNGKFDYALGNSVHMIQMEDFINRKYKVTRF